MFDAVGIAGTLLLRFGLVAADGPATDPHASFDVQRRGHEAADIATKGEAAPTPSFPGVDATGKESFHAGAGV